MGKDLAAYRAAVDFMESLLRPQTEPVDEADMRRHFERMGYFLNRLGSPQERFASVHVAGTSGKGSTTAMIGAILTAAGLRTGVHCTPYLQAPIERMQVEGLYASPGDFARLVDELRPHIAHMQNDSAARDISYREVAVAQAFLHFAESGVEAAAIETGMGGRYDYTNHVRPLVSAIVTVDYDHVATLGPTLERIAHHKAGIIKDGVPIVTGVTHPQALGVIEAEAAAHAAPLYRFGRDIICTCGNISDQGTVFDYASPWAALRGLHVGMLGRHQMMNAGLAVSVVMLLRARGYTISDDAIRAGLSAARLPGRLEIMEKRPVVALDGAHNREKMHSLAAGLGDLYPGQRPVLVVGVLAAKQVDDILREVVPLASHVVATTALVRAKPAVDPDHLAAACRRLGSHVLVEPDVRRAVERARRLAGVRGLVCVTGSLYMVGQAREMWVPTQAILEQRTSFPRLG
jgi:dihydrofolate synthase/folylpolyglutamate synthase